MARITNRAGFIQYCLRRLGEPVIKINVSPEQLEDRVDDAMKYYVDYHYDATNRTYFKHQLTEQDIANEYLTVPENIIGVVNLFPIGANFQGNNIFNVRYQFFLNYITDITSQQIAPYYMAEQYIQLLQELLVGQQPLRYNRNENKLFIDMDWRKVTPGEYIIYEAFLVLDPDVYADIWNDRWVQRYATVLIKEQWGSNLTKFRGMQLPGNVQFNGDAILASALEEKETLESQVISQYSLPIPFLLG